METQTALSKFIANNSRYSRRKTTELIKSGKVQIDGETVTNPGRRISETNKIIINGYPLKITKKKFYFLVYKPIGYLSTAKDTHNRPIVTDLLPKHTGLYPVGRLDKNSHGAIILTNDGDFANFLTHPKNHIPKTYEVSVKGKVTPEKIHQFQTGIELDWGQTAPAKIKIKAQDQGTTVLEIIMYEGKKRQIREMSASLRWFVLDLKRTAIGSLSLGDLKPKESRPITRKELALLKAK
jgi:23S rRNA pseudouridine2605 synthase